jgi:hypothetical protein
VDFRGQILKNARFWDSDVPYRIGCWRGFWVMLGELGVKGKGFCSTKVQISIYFLCIGHVPDRIGCWWGVRLAFRSQLSDRKAIKPELSGWLVTGRWLISES